MGEGEGERERERERQRGRDREREKGEREGGWVVGGRIRARERWGKWRSVSPRAASFDATASILQLLYYSFYTTSSILQLLYYSFYTTVVQTRPACPAQGRIRWVHA